MKKVVASLFLLFSFVMIYAAEPDSTAFNSRTSDPIDRNNCTCKGIPLYGRVKVVTHTADFDVKVVESAEDLDVRIITYSPGYCGEWQFVEHTPDFTVRFVEHASDFTVRFVNNAPGVH